MISAPVDVLVLDDRGECVTADVQAVDERLCLGITRDGDRDVDVTRESGFRAKRYRQASDDRPAR